MLKIELSYRGLLTILGAVFAVWVVLHLWPVLLLLLISLVLMIGLLPYVDAMARRGLPRPLAVLIIVIGFIGLLSLLIGALVPAMLSEFRNLRDNLPESAREVELLASKIGIEIELQQRAREFDWNELFSGNEALDYGQQVLATTLSLITIVAMTAYLLADTPRLGAFIRQFIPAEKVEDADKVFLSLTRVVGGYLRGQLITSLSIGVFTFVMLTIVGVSNPLAFAVLAALADVVPLVGALVATAPPVAAALQESAGRAAIVLVAMIAYQQFEDRLLVPRVYGRMLNLPPLIVLIAVLAGAELLGITGVLLALPIAAAARVAVDYFYGNRTGVEVGETVEQSLAPDTPAPKRRVTLRMPGRKKTETAES
jgi:predicted PurR-regulated permease PerM